MPTTLLKGVRVPQGSDQSAPQVDMRLLGQSVRTVLTAASLTDAVNAVNAARTELGWEATPSNPILVRRSDLGAIAVWDGASWAYNVDREFELIAAEATKPALTAMRIAAGSQILTTDGAGKAVLDWRVAFKYVVTIIIATGDRTAAHTVSKGQWNNVQGCDIFAAFANGTPAARANVRVNYIVIGW